MGIAGFPLSDQWAALVSPHTIVPAEMAARIDAQMNAIGAYISEFPSATDVAAEVKTAGAQAVALGANILFPTIITNPSGGWSTSTGVYTAPVAGSYFAYASAVPATAISLQIAFRTSGSPPSLESRGDTLTSGTVALSLWLTLAAGGTIALERVDGGGGNVSAALMYIRRIGA